MSDPKRHHYISQFLLRGFADDDGYLHAFDRRRRVEGVTRAGTTKLFVEKHLYSSIDRDGSRDTRLEKAYAKLEDEAAELVAKITASARKREPPGLSATERHRFDRFVYHHIKRSPDFISGRTDLVNYKQLLDRAAAELEASRGPFAPREAADLESPEAVKRMYQNSLVWARAQGGEDVRRAFSSRGLAVAVVSPSNKSLVVGSYPFITLNTPGILSGPTGTHEMWIPIARDVAVTFFGLPPSERIVEINGADTRKINERSARKSAVIAGPSGALTKSLSRFMRGDRDAT